MATRCPTPLAALLAAGLILAVGWSVATAPLQGPDEHNHFGYVQYLAETGSGPDFGGSGRRTWSTEQEQWMRWERLLGLIGNVTARPGWTEAEQQAWRAEQQRLPDAAREDGVGPNPVAQNPPLYYAYSAIPYRVAGSASISTRQLVVRLANVPFFLIIIACAWAAAGELFGRWRWLQTIAAGSVALLPQLGFMAGVVNTDILLAAIWAAFTWLALAAVRIGPTRGTLAGLGLLAGASFLTHGRGIAIAGPLLVVLAVLLWRALPLERRVLVRLGGAGAIALAGAVLALVYSAAHGGTSSIADEAGAAAGAGSARGFLTYLWQFYLPPLETMTRVGPDYGYRQVFIEGLTGTFASLEVMFPRWVYDAVQVAAGFGLATLLVLVARGWERIRARAATLLVLVSLPLSLLLVVHGAAYRQVISPPHDPLITGRYLLPLAVLLGLAIAYVCARLPRPAGAVLGAATLVAMATLALSGLGMTVARFYA